MKKQHKTKICVNKQMLPVNEELKESSPKLIKQYMCPVIINKYTDTQINKQTNKYFDK